MEPTEAKHEQIYQAAVAEFQEKGFADASMDRISARAGASKRTVYKHFESKEKLFQELVRRHWNRLVSTLDVRYDKDRDIRDQLTALGQAEGRLMTSPEVMSMSRLVISELLRSPDLVEQNEEKTDCKAALEKMLRDATSDGQLKVEDPRAATEEFIGLLKARAFWPVVLGAPMVSGQEMDEIIENAVTIMMCRYGT